MQGCWQTQKNCTEIISCEVSISSYAPVKYSCLAGYGLNPITGECQKGLDRLCFEISNFNHTLNNLVNSLPNFIKTIVTQVNNLLSTFDIDYSFLFKVGIPQEFVSTALLIGNYFLTHKFMLPPLLLNSVLEFIIQFIPPNLRIPLEMIIAIVSGKSPFLNSF